jgi:hypothetical protein
MGANLGWRGETGGFCQDIEVRTGKASGLPRRGGELTVSRVVLRQKVPTVVIHIMAFSIYCLGTPWKQSLMMVSANNPLGKS